MLVQWGGAVKVTCRKVFRHTFSRLAIARTGFTTFYFHRALWSKEMPFVHVTWLPKGEWARDNGKSFIRFKCEHIYFDVSQRNAFLQEIGALHSRYIFEMYVNIHSCACRPQGSSSCCWRHYQGSDCSRHRCQGRYPHGQTCCSFLRSVSAWCIVFWSKCIQKMWQYI